MPLSVAGLRDVGLGVLVELGEEFMDAGDGGLVGERNFLGEAGDGCPDDLPVWLGCSPTRRQPCDFQS
jgi:hypothetical protein